MKKAVYKHLLHAYGNLPLLWIGIVTECIRTLTQKVFLVLIVSYLALDMATGSTEKAKSLILLFILVYIAGTLIGALGELLAIKTTDTRYKVLLMNYYQKLVGKDLSFYRDHQTGYLISLFRQHLDGTMALVRLHRSDAVRMFVSLFGPVVVLFFVRPPLGLLAVVTVLILGAYVMWSFSRVNKYRKPAQEIYRKLTGEVSDELTNAVAFKSAGHESESLRKVAELSEEEMKNFWLRHKAVAFFDLPRIALTGLAMVFGFYIALNTTRNGIESVGLIVLIFIYLLQIMQSIGELPDLISRNDEHIAKVYPTLEYLGNAYESIMDIANPQSLRMTKAEIQLQNVAFAYKTKKSHPVFTDMNLIIKGGEHVGIIGLSGAGKSTLAGLLMRFDDVDGGSIAIDGVDIRNMRQSELRQKISYVPQEPLLFHRTIKENILYFNREATDEEMISAAKIAHAHDFILDLSEGYNTTVGERGVKLSGGQKQRIVLARALLKNASIIIFDEATSALDSESEKLIQDAIPRMIHNRTAIIIAHRLSSISRLDRILVMHEGKIIEQGTHAELLNAKGSYFSMWQKQSMYS